MDSLLPMYHGAPRKRYDTVAMGWARAGVGAALISTGTWVALFGISRALDTELISMFWRGDEKHRRQMQAAKLLAGK